MAQLATRLLAQALQQQACGARAVRRGRRKLQAKGGGHADAIAAGGVAKEKALLEQRHQIRRQRLGGESAGSGSEQADGFARTFAQAGGIEPAWHEHQTASDLLGFGEALLGIECDVPARGQRFEAVRVEAQHRFEELHTWWVRETGVSASSRWGFACRGCGRASDRSDRARTRSRMERRESRSRSWAEGSCRPSYSRSSAATWRSSSSRESMGALCWLAQAPSWLPRGRVAK